MTTNPESTSNHTDTIPPTMPAPTEEETPQTQPQQTQPSQPSQQSQQSQGHHIELPAESETPKHEGEGSTELKDHKGWDGKARVSKSATLKNPEALSDPEYSDEDNVVPGEQIEADEDLLDEEDPETDEIICTHARIRSIPALRLERFKNLQRLCLRQNLIQEIEGLDGIADTIQELDLYDNLISHVRGLDKLVNLTSLDLSFNKIKHIKHVNHLTNLTDLFFVANKISKIENLEGLTKLRNLELGSNRIRELQNLSHLTALEELWVAKNKITSLNGLAGLNNLRLLSIQSNRIRDLSPLKDIPQLEELYISHNGIESLEGISHNTRLRVLEVSSNRITSLKGIGPLKQLEEFWASYNQLGDWTEVERELADKENLTTVYFEGNPLQTRQPALYRNKVRLLLPQVRQIDATMTRVD